MNSDELQRVLILGAGIMGRQIGLQCARYGYEVRIYDIMPEALQSAEQQIKSYAMEFVSEGMLSESQAAAATGRPDRFCALHFHQPVWYSNVVDIMPHPGTAAETVELLHDFARSIDQIPIFVKREHPAYVFNTMLDALLSSAMELAAEDVASVQEIDRAWMGITKMPIGPFGILDLVGIDLAYEITTQKTKWVSFLPKAKRVINLLKEKVDQGHLGQKSGSSFYQYPNPVFGQPGFLSGSPATAETATAADID